MEFVDGYLESAIEGKEIEIQPQYWSEAITTEPRSSGSGVLTYALQKTNLLLGALNFLNSHYTEKALHKLAHYNNHFTLLCHDKTNYMQWLS